MEGGGLKNMALQKLWKDLWNMKMPNKIKIFSWKACKESLPTKHNLMKKQVIHEDLCLFCKIEVEDVAHALCLCPSLREARERYLPIVLSTGLPTHYGDIASYLSGLNQNDKLELFFLISWSYWYRRNSATFEDKCIHIEQAISHAMAVQKAYKVERGQPLKVVRHHCKWEYPPPGVFKLNVDGAMFQNQHSAGIGAVLRDCEGEVLMAVSKREKEVSDATGIAMLAIFRGLQLSVHLGINHLIVESDALTLVQDLQKSEPYMALVGNVIKDTKKIMDCCKKL